MRLNFCVLCGQDNPNTLEHHHFIPKVCGGTDEEDNMFTVCGTCHGRVHNISRPLNLSDLIKEGRALNQPQTSSDYMSRAEQKTKEVERAKNNAYWLEAIRFLSENPGLSIEPSVQEEIVILEPNNEIIQEPNNEASLGLRTEVVSETNLELNNEVISDPVYEINLQEIFEPDNEIISEINNEIISETDNEIAKSLTSGQSIDIQTPIQNRWTAGTVQIAGPPLTPSQLHCATLPKYRYVWKRKIRRRSYGFLIINGG
jgi:hypothetical protein